MGFKTNEGKKIAVWDGENSVISRNQVVEYKREIYESAIEVDDDSVNPPSHAGRSFLNWSGLNGNAVRIPIYTFTSDSERVEFTYQAQANPFHRVFFFFDGSDANSRQKSLIHPDGTFDTGAITSNVTLNGIEYANNSQVPFDGELKLAVVKPTPALRVGVIGSKFDYTEGCAARMYDFKIKDASGRIVRNYPLRIDAIDYGEHGNHLKDEECAWGGAWAKAVNGGTVSGWDVIDNTLSCQVSTNLTESIQSPLKRTIPAGTAVRVIFDAVVTQGSFGFNSFSQIPAIAATGHYDFCLVTTNAETSFRLGKSKTFIGSIKNIRVLALDGELCPSPSLDNATPFVVGGGVVISGGKASFASTANPVKQFSFTSAIVAGRKYRVCFAISNRTQGGLYFRLNNETMAPNGAVVSANGIHHHSFTALQTTGANFFLSTADNFNGDVTSFSVTEDKDGEVIGSLESNFIRYWRRKGALNYIKPDTGILKFGESYLISNSGTYSLDELRYNSIGGALRVVASKGAMPTISMSAHDQFRSRRFDVGGVLQASITINSSNVHTFIFEGETVKVLS